MRSLLKLNEKEGFPGFQTGVVLWELVGLDVDFEAREWAERVVACDWWDARVSARREGTARFGSRGKTSSRSGACEGRGGYVE
jgi:hypothetical protein